MLSICIPVFNFDVQTLVQDLHRQALQTGVEFEILLTDDASGEQYRVLNRELTALPQVRYEELPQNIGRSRIRNRLLGLSHYPYLLFLDCDSAIPADDFVARYVAECSGEVVVCGGRSYFPEEPPAALKLRWLYGVKREMQPAQERSRHPNRSFMTNNFLIARELLAKIQFNEKLSGYGHEDTLFGYELKQRGVQIRHIENPAVHIGLETAEEFLEKTAQGIRNLYRLYMLLNKNKDFAEDIRLLRYYRKLERLHLAPVFALLFRQARQKLLAQLMSPEPSLQLFDVYKLGLLCEAGASEVQTAKL